jgi:Fe-S-cluster-containing hydrogenase component 2
VTERSVFIAIHPAAPPKPVEGAACNGCGVCCLLEPCPVGMLVSGKRRGACDALTWSEAESRYRCGMVAAPEQHLPGWLVRAPRMQGLASRWARHFIAAGIGCDSDAELD